MVLAQILADPAYLIDHTALQRSYPGSLYLFLLAVLVSMPELNYESWRKFSKNSVRLFSVIALLRYAVTRVGM